MRKFRQVCRWLMFGFVFLLALAVTGLLFYTHTDDFREFVRQKLLAAISDSVQGKISVARLDGSVWGDVTLIDVRLFDTGNEIVRIPRVRINYSLLPLLWGQIQVFRLEASQPLLRLREGQDGVWNIVAALSPAEPQPETSALVVLLNSVELQKGHIDVSFSGSDQRSYRLRDLDLQGTVSVRSSVVAVELREASSHVFTEGMPEARVNGALGYRSSGLLETLKFDQFSIESGNSKVRLTGKIDDLKAFNTEVKVSVDRLAPADVAQFVPQWPVKGDVSGTLNVHGPLNALAGDFSLAVAAGSLSGNFQADVKQATPLYQGTVRINGIDMSKLLERKDLQGVMSGVAEAKAKGFALSDIAAQGEVNVRSVETAGWNLGDVFVKANLARSEARMTGRLKSDLGHADWQGQIDFKESPQYEIAFSANRLDIQKLSAGKAIKGGLNLDGLIKGSGLTLATINARAKINLKRSTIGAVNVEQGTLVATLADQRIRVSAGSLKAAETTLSVRGDIGTDLKQQGNLDYQLRVGTLSPWLELIDRKGSGSLTVTGGAKGNLSELKAHGRITARSVSFEGTTVERGSIDYNLGYSSARSLPIGTLNFSLVDVRSGYRLQTLEGVVKTPPQIPNTFELDAKARDAQGRTHTLAANVEYQPEHLVVRMTRLTLDLPDGIWRLSQPATVDQRSQDFLVERLLMRNNDRQFLLDGRFSLAGSQALRLNVERLPLESFRAFFPEGPDVTGIFSAQAQLGGTAAAPEIVATIKLDNSKILGQSYGGLVVVGTYRNQKVDLKATVQQDRLHQLNANGSLPMLLSWINGWRAETLGNMEARVQSSGLSLAFLNAFSGKAIQGISGEIEMDLQVRGFLSEPVASGFFRVREGKLTTTALGVQVSSIMAEGLLQPRGIRFSQVSARANKGELSGSGFVALNKFSPQAINFALALKQWPAINTLRYQMELNGSANVDGTLAAPRIAGMFEVPRGELRPDLSFLDSGSTPIKRDPTITVVSTNVAGGSPSATRQQVDNQADSELWRNASVEIQIRIPNNLWVRHRNGTAELSGNLKVTKAVGGTPVIKGLIETIRGWVGFQGRRFTLSRGEIEFNGSEKINPSLDIVAEYRVSNYLVNVVVKGAAEKPTLTLTSDPRLDQADILSLLLFNKPISSLGKSEQASLQENAINITSGFAAARIGQAVSDALGLQDLGVDIGDVDFSGGQVRFGQYLGQSTYVSFSQEVSGKHGREVSGEYRITSDWKFSVSSSTTGLSGIDIIWQKRY
jgi:autotransporter translocation and assembly factor TamB